ncbi:UDP-glucose 4-epimerase-like [Panonychus citri]|uniref:UDP-glucose 4-epimerase-like n=1 Tax=Panonychus citri TaxID=50023 RepID=UPI002307FDF1|nr:UDP-glucose 4-epimerase-like [Panonychus citri]
MSRVILVTGGAGFVGSHCVLTLLEANYEIIVMDNLSNAICTEINQNCLPESLRRIELLTSKKVKFFNTDLLDERGIGQIFRDHKIGAVMHFAGLKAVGESMVKPLEYYENNVTGTINLLKVMRKYNVKNLIFSSSATVYGLPQYLPIDENHPTGSTITNPYGRTKFVIEQILSDLSNSEKDWCIVSLRYFNPIGAHESGEIGEDPQGIPNNLMPFISQVAVGRRPKLQVFGDDFKTKDGTGVRDYIHVMDLAWGHVIALDKLFQNKWSGYKIFNLGNGCGLSVLEVITAFEKITGVKVPYEIVARRPGDVDAMYADNSKAIELLGWKPNYTIDDMCKHTWNWQSKNPKGYRTDNS